MKKRLLLILSICLVITSINIIKSNEIKRTEPNIADYHELEPGAEIEDLEPQEILYDVKINDDTVNNQKIVTDSGDVKEVDEVPEEVVVKKAKLNEDEVANEVVEFLEEESEKDVVAELESDGYVLNFDASDHKTYVLQKGSEIKVIAYQEEVAPKTRVAAQRVISEDTPYSYTQDEVELEFFVKNEELVLFKEIDGILVYKSGSGFVTQIRANKTSTTIRHSITDIDTVIENSYSILSDHTFKLIENSDANILEIYDADDVLVTTFFVTNTFDYFLDQENEVQSEFDNFIFEIEENTKTAIIKTQFEEGISEEIKDETEYVVELATFENVRGTIDRDLRGTRQNGPNYAYPYIAGTSDIPMGGAGEPFKVRMGKNIESFIGGFSSLNSGYYEDRTNYNEVVNSLGVKTRLIDADLKMYLVGPPSGSGGYMTNEEYFALHCTLYGTFCTVSEQAKNGTYILNAMDGEYNPRQLSYNNINQWDTEGKISYSAAGINTTTINYAQSTSEWIDFDVSHAVGGWLRNNNPGKQMLQINNFGPDNYFATKALGDNYAPYIELTLEELPDFEKNPYLMENTDVKVRSFTKNSHQGAVNNVAIGIDGLTAMNALVKYEVYEVEGGAVVERGSTKYGAQGTYAFPMYLTDIENINNYYLVESNYQVEKLISTQDLDANKVYGVRVMPYFEDSGNLVTDTGEVINESEARFWYEGDTFQIYPVGYKYEVLDRILNFYGRNTDELRSESYFDNNMHNHLISDGNRLFIRNPSKNQGKAYVQTDLTDLDKYLIDQGLMGMGQECEYGFEPINFNTGNFVYSSSDALIHSKGKEVSFVRYYNALEDAAPSSFGRNWSSTIDYRMQILYNGSVVFKDETGKSHIITQNEDGTYNRSDNGYTYEREVSYVEQRIVDVGYYSTARGDVPITETISIERYNHIFTSSSGDKIYFDDGAKLSKLVNLNGDTHTFVSGYLGVDRYILPDGKVINFAYNSNAFVEKVSFEDGTVLSYEYDENDNLISYTDQNGIVVKYNYESDLGSNLMTSYESNGTVFIENKYDDEKRVVEQKDNNGNISKLSYEDGYTVLTDNNGNEFEVHYNEIGHTTKVINNGLTEEKIYNDAKQVVQKNVIDEEGNKLSTFYEYDGIGNIIKTTYPTGEVATFEYDGFNLLAATAQGETTTYNYDSNNNLISTDKDGITQNSNVYDSNGNLLEEVNKYGGVTKYTYYEDGNIHTVTSPLGNIVTYEYDKLGFMTKKITELGEVITYERSYRGELLKTTYSDGSYELYEYNDFGNMIAKRDRDGIVFNYEYDNLGNQLKVITPYYEITKSYDGNNNLIKEVDANGNVTKFEYDASNRLIKTIHPSGHIEEQVYNSDGMLISASDNVGVTQENTYDGFNNHVESVSLGNTTTNIYSGNNLIATFDNDILQQRYTYDSKGEVEETLTATGVVSKQDVDELGIIRSSTNGLNTDVFEYDSEGNNVKTVNSLGHTTTTVYGAYNLVLETTDADNITTEYTYNESGKELSKTVGGVLVETTTYTSAGRVKTKTDGEGNTTTYYYDKLGRVDYLVYPNGGVEDYTYDGNGNIIEKTDPASNKTLYEFDSMNREVAIISADGSKTTKEYDIRGNVVIETRQDYLSKNYTYNKNNKVIKETDYNGVETEYFYDDKNRVYKTTRSTGEETIVEFDNFGRQVSETTYNKTSKTNYDEFNRVTSNELIDGRITSKEYDILGREIKSINEYGEVINNEYSATGKLLKVIYEDGTFEQTEYDVLGNVIKTIDRLGNATHKKYDNNSNLIEEIDAANNSTKTEYDNMNNVIKITDALGNETTFEYHINGNKYKTTDALGNITTQKYDNMNRVISEVDELNYETRMSYDKLGQIIEIVRKDNVVETYEYDISGNEISKKVGSIKLYTKEFDLKGNLISEKDANSNETQYEYDEEGRLVKEIAPNGKETKTKYDKYGNVLKVSDDIGVIEESTYDIHHRLISKKDAFGNETTYSYEEKGTKVLSETTANNKVRLYSYDVLDREVTSVDELGISTQKVYDSVGNVIEVIRNGVSTYSVYDANNNLIEEVDELGVSTHYEYDKLNRQVKVVDGNNNITKITYDKLGRELERYLNDTLTTSYEYDSTNVIKEIDGNGDVVEYSYDSLGNVDRSKQNDELIVNYTYDNNNNLLKMTKNSKIIQEYKYDEMNNALYFENTQLIKHYYEYDIRNRMVKEIKNDGLEVMFEYDNADNIVKETAGNEVKEHVYNDYGYIETTTYNVEEETYSTTITYDDFNRIVEVVDVNDNVIEYEYDELNRRTSLTYSDGSTQEYEYNDKGVITSTVNTDGVVIDFIYDNNYNIVSEVYSNGVSATFTYDSTNQPLTMEYKQGSEVIEASNYVYDEGGRVVENTRKVDGKVIEKSYEYDELDQVSKASYQIQDGMINTSIIYEYEYDKLSNRSLEKVTTDGETVVYEEMTNKLGQVISRIGDGSKTYYEYDKNGNLIEEMSEGTTTNYEYNSFGKLSKTLSDDLVFEEFNYDGFGNRVGKTTYDYYSGERVGGRQESSASLKSNLLDAIENGLDCKGSESLDTLENSLKVNKECELNTTSYSGFDKQYVEYVNDITYENAVVLEVKEEVTTQNTYVYNKPLTSSIDNAVEVNVLSKTNSINARIGEDIQVHEYEVNGKEIEVINDFKIINELGFNGEIEDNLELQYLRARYYKQDSARFISEDTYRGEVGRGQSHNAYIYVENNGVKYVDSSGNRAEEHSDAPTGTVINSGPGYKVYLNSDGTTTRVITNKIIYSTAGRILYNIWKEKYYAPKPTMGPYPEVVAENTKPKFPDAIYTSDFGLDPNDPQFKEKAIICDQLTASGISEQGVKTILEECETLEELNEFLEWLNNNPGGTYNDWKALRGDFFDGLMAKGSDYHSLVKSGVFWGSLLAIAAVVIGITIATGGLGAIPALIIDLIFTAAGVGALIWEFSKLKAVGYSNSYIAGFLALDVAFCIIDLILIGVSLNAVVKVTKVTNAIGKGIKTFSKADMLVLVDKAGEFEKVLDASGDTATFTKHFDEIFDAIKNNDNTDNIIGRFFKSGNKIGDNFDDLYKAMYKHEQGMVDNLLAQGKKVELVDAKSGWTYDANVDGIPTELKFASGTEDSARDLVSKGFKQLPPGEGNVIIDITQSQATRETLLARLAGNGYDTSRIIIID